MAALVARSPRRPTGHLWRVVIDDAKDAPQMQRAELEAHDEIALQLAAEGLIAKNASHRGQTASRPSEARLYTTRHITTRECTLAVCMVDR